jgi:predicted CoA-binding protein
VTDVKQILESANSVLVVDWPTRDVPEALARAGYTVVVAGGPEPDNYSAHELRDGDVVVRRVGRRPAHADLVYSHRPLGELGGIVATAREVGAKTVWCQSGRASTGADDPKGCWLPEEKSREARNVVESAGLDYVDDVYIADAVRQLGIKKV